MIEINKSVLRRSDVETIKSLTPLKYKWANKLYLFGDSCMWLPNVVTMKDDIGDYREATEDERTAYERTLGYLNAADIAAIANVNRAISAKIDAPELECLFAQIGYQEANHSRSYLYMLESLGMDAEKQDEINHLYLRHEPMLAKIAFTNDMVKKLVALPDEDMNDEEVTEFVHGYVFFSQIFEGCFFLAGFNPILSMYRREKFIHSATMINYIRRDEEQLHVNTGLLTIQQILREHPNVKLDQDRIHAMIKEANRLEYDYIKLVMPNGLTGYSIADHMQYFRYLGNKVCTKLELELVFPPEASETLPWIRQLTTKILANSFEQRSLEYDLGTNIRSTFAD